MVVEIDWIEGGVLIDPTLVAQLSVQLINYFAFGIAIIPVRNLDYFPFSVEGV